MTLPHIALALGLLTAANSQSTEAATPRPELAHVVNTFQFPIAAPLDRLAPLFGPEGERAWAGEHWNPEFLYPVPAKDIQGAVFKVRHGDHLSTWINTLFDLAHGRMQYVSFLDSVAVSTIDVSLTASDRSHTVVTVTYTRTALQPAANDDVRALGDKDRESGPGWQKSIEEFLLNHPS
jgi:hypothetical protein